MSAFEPWLTRWRLTPDGEPITTPAGGLLPVLAEGAPAMLKISTAPEERRGGALMVWYAGGGAARVLAHQDDAILLERLDGPRSLETMARNGQDDEATLILCQAALRLQAPRGKPPPDTLTPMVRWFRQLEPAAAKYGGVLVASAAMARDLLAAPRDVVVVHGDVHHGNVLDGGDRGWLAIDPKGVLGERGFDFANILCNPHVDVSLAPGRLARRVEIVSETTGIEPRRILSWLLAYAGLSAAWTLDEGEDAANGPRQALNIAEAAQAALNV